LSTDVARGTRTQLGGSTARSTDISSKSCDARGLCAVDRVADRTLGRSTDSRVRTNSGPDLELFWGFLLLPINRGCEPLVRVNDFWRVFLREPIIILLYLV